ncbi:MAG: carboxypeptidase regulatory-like domain-containing protein [Candidatus Cloacimonetes bacterium]|nr:carboxypeptidase regulatory-like domain-containing protein [Candidatus Cloacimonadota bacterium]
MKKKLILLFMASIILLLMIACETKPTEPSPIPDQTILKGRVVYNGEGLDNVQITVGSAGSKLTDENGNFEFRDIAPGLYTIVCYKPGFEEVTFQVDVIEARTTSVEIAINKLQIIGTVRDALTLEPLSMVCIQTTPPTGAINTDGNGRYVIDLTESGTYTILATKNGYFPNSVTVNVNRLSVTADINLTSTGSFQVNIIEGPEDLATVTTANVAFSWVAPGATYYEFRISNTEHLYPEVWTQIDKTTITLSDLDELTDDFYKFEIRAKNLQQTSEIVSRRFKVSAINNNSIWLKHRRQSVSSIASDFELEVMFKEVANVALVNVEIEFDNNKFYLTDIEKEESFWQQSDPDAEIIFLYSEISDANAEGKLDFSIGLVNSENLVESGSGCIATLKFIARNFDGSTKEILFTNQTEIRDQDNQNIPISEKVNAKVELE